MLGFCRPHRMRDLAANPLPALSGPLAMLAAVALAGASGCGKDEGLPAGKITRPVDVILGHLPGDAWAVVGINAARAREVPALKKLVDWLPPAPLEPKVARSCGFEKLGGVDLAVAALGGGPRDDDVFVALHGGFTNDSMSRCITSLEAATGERMSVERQGSLTAYDARSGGGKSYVYWPTPDFVIVSPQTKSSRAALDRLIGAAGIKSNRSLMSYLGRVRTDAAFWMAGSLPPEVQKQLSGLGPGVPVLQGFFVTVDGEGAGDPVRVVLGLRLGGEREARAAAKAFREQKAELAKAVPDPRARAIVGKLDVAQHGAEVALQASLDAAEAAFLVEMTAGMAGLPGAAP